MLTIHKSLDTDKFALQLPAYHIHATGSGFELFHIKHTNEIRDGVTKPIASPKKICDLAIGLSYSIKKAIEEIIAREDINEDTNVRLWIEPVDRIWLMRYDVDSDAYASS